MIIPEFQLYNLVETLVTYVKSELQTNPDESKTILYNIFNGVKFGKLDLFELSKEFFSRKKDHPRQLEIRLGFDASRAQIPTIHITLPSERSGPNGIGVDEGYLDSIIDDVDKTITPVFTRTFENQYAIIVTSDNTLEVILLYNLLKSLFISITESVELAGLRNVKFSGQDVQLNASLVSANIFARGLMLDFFYELSVKRLLSQPLINNILFEGRAIDDLST